MRDDSEPADDFEREFLQLDPAEQSALNEWGGLTCETFRRLRLGALGLGGLIAEVLQAHQQAKAGQLDAAEALELLAAKATEDYSGLMYESSPPAERAAFEAKCRAASVIAKAKRAP